MHFFLEINVLVSAMHRTSFKFGLVCALSNSLFQADRKSLPYLSMFWQLEWKDRKLKKNHKCVNYTIQKTIDDFWYQWISFFDRCEYTYANVAPIHSKGISNPDIILLNKMFTYHWALHHLLSKGLTSSQSKRFPNAFVQTGFISEASKPQVLTEYR